MLDLVMLDVRFQNDRFYQRIVECHQQVFLHGALLEKCLKKSKKYKGNSLVKIFTGYKSDQFLFEFTVINFRIDDVYQSQI